MSIDGLDQNFNDIQRRFQYLNEEEERRKVFDVGLDIRRGVRIPIVVIGFFGSSHFLELVVKVFAAVALALVCRPLKMYLATSAADASAVAIFSLINEKSLRAGLPTRNVGHSQRKCILADETICGQQRMSGPIRSTANRFIFRYYRRAAKRHISCQQQGHTHKWSRQLLFAHCPSTPVDGIDPNPQLCRTLNAI